MKRTLGTLFAALLPCAASALAAPPPDAESPLPIPAVHDITGFVGQRMAANKTGSIDGLAIDRYLRMLETHNTTAWFWIGEQPGKWLESAILTAAATKDPALEAKAREVLARILKAQQPDGYLGIGADRLRTPERPLRGMDPYEQYFTFHALLTAYEVWGDKPALAAATKLADYYLNNIGPGQGQAQFWPSPYRPPENTNTIICEQLTWVPPNTPKAPKLFVQSDIAGHTAHYSLEGTLVVDPILRLHQLTGEKRFLDWAQWTVSQIDTWSGWNTFSKLDQVADGTLGIHQLQPYVHSHTFHMNFLGFLRLYQITGDPSLLRKVEGAWQDIANRQLYITGGVSAQEHYKPGYERPMEGHVVETCANMSWLQLNQALLQITGNPRYADAIEKLLVNHVFAAQTLDGDSNRYHTAPNGLKPDDYFHGPDCCTSSGQRQIAMIPQFLYAQSQDTLVINQFVPSIADFTLNDTKIALVQETTFPEGESIKIKLNPAAPCAFTIKLRLPAWCDGPALTLNGKPADGLRPGTYFELTRTWAPGDTLELTLPMKTQWVAHDHFPQKEAPFALTRGPVVYALDTVWWDDAKTESKRPQNVSQAAGIVRSSPPKRTATGPRSVGPFFAAPVQIAGHADGAAPVTATFVPFSNIGRWYPEKGDKPAKNSRAYSYAVWLFDASSETFTTRARDISLSDAWRKEALDYVIPMDPSEQSHALKADPASLTGNFNNRTFRDGPSFSYVMTVPTDSSSRLLVTYWGGEKDVRLFDIFVDDLKVGSETLFDNKPGQFYEQSYDIPFDLIEGKTNAAGQKVNQVTVRFVARPGSVAGGIFGIRILKK